MRRWLVSLLLLAGCATAAREPVLPQLRDAPSKPVVILVPGVTGVELRERESGRIVWGNAASLLRPRDGGHAIALPITRQSEDALVPGEVIREMRLLGYRREVYGTIFRLMEANAIPFVAHAYDWRRDVVTSARELAAVVRAHGEVVLLCQSNAASICRYLYLYGDVSLEEAEGGLRRVPEGISKVIFIGTSNGGAIRILRELDRGRQYIPFAGRRMQPETLFSFRSLFTDLPSYEESWFVDEHGELLADDLYDATIWIARGWSIFSTGARVRAPVSRFGSEEERMAYVRAQLDGAQRVQRLLRSARGGRIPLLYSIQSVSFATPHRAAILDGSPRFTGDREVSRRPALEEAITARGDLHATRQSQEWLSDDERAALAHPPVHVGERHFEMITMPEAQTWILRFLAEGLPQATASVSWR
jgi:hypothetical protein